MNFSLSEELKLLRNRILTAALLLVLSLNMLAQNNQSAFRRSLNSDSIKLKVQSHYLQKSQRNVFALPIVSWNNYDKLHAGAGVFSNPVVPKNLTYRLFGFWSFGASTFNHAAYISHTIKVGENSKIEPFVRSNSFSYNHIMREKLQFLGVRAGVKGEFLNKNNEKNFKVLLELHHVSNQIMMWNVTDSMYHKTDRKLSIAEVQFEGPLICLSDEDVQVLRGEFNKDVGKVSFTSSHSFQYLNPKKSFDIRLFAGGFLYKQLPSENDFRFRLSGISGRNDYLYNYSYPYRSEVGYNFMANQMFPGDGYFKTAVPLGQTWDWLFAANFRTDLPGFLPFQIYLDVATYKDAGTLFPGNARVPWNAGVVVKILKNKAEIYLPLFMSQDIRNIYEVNNANFLSRISWMVRFDQLNPFKTLKK
jgi:hypothetical protein